MCAAVNNRMCIKVHRYTERERERERESCEQTHPHTSAQVQTHRHTEKERDSHEQTHAHTSMHAQRETYTSTPLKRDAVNATLSHLFHT